MYYDQDLDNIYKISYVNSWEFYNAKFKSCIKNYKIIKLSNQFSKRTHLQDFYTNLNKFLTFLIKYYNKNIVRIVQDSYINL